MNASDMLNTCESNGINYRGLRVSNTWEPSLQLGIIKSHHERKFLFGIIKIPNIKRLIAVRWARAGLGSW